ncbi:hypothetical protein R1sor_022978 [Riccia sorocarpa]|uniref:Uncharacterized protein n=1 Tax=Riccia sorocarpa TaxID=122646 RepID=A0ABD3GNG0_9MARC
MVGVKMLSNSDAMDVEARVGKADREKVTCSVNHEGDNQSDKDSNHEVSAGRQKNFWRRGHTLRNGGPRGRDEVDSPVGVQNGANERSATGFQAWMHFTAADRMRQKHAIFGTPAGLKEGDHIVTQEDEHRWAEGITWEMIAVEMEAMLTMVDFTNEDEGKSPLIDMDVPKAASKLGSFCKTATIHQTVEAAPSRDRVVNWVRDMIV